MTTSATIVHIEDEIRKNSGLWNYIRGAIAESITDGQLELFKKNTISDTVSKKIFSYSWPNDTKESSLTVATFSNAQLASKYLISNKEKNIFFILDTRNQITNEDVLNDNVEVVREYIDTSKKNIRIFSAYCDAVLAAYSREQKVRRDQEVLVPSSWRLPETEGLPLSELMIKKTDSESLRHCLLRWMNGLGLVDFGKLLP